MNANSYDRRLARVLARLPVGLRADLIGIFEAEATYQRVGDRKVPVVPSIWSAATRLIRAQSVLMASVACKPDLAPNNISDLLAIEVLRCLRRKVTDEKTWKYATLGSVLSSLRTLYRMRSDKPLPHIDGDISYANRQERTFKDDRVLSTEQYIDQAAMLWAFGVGR